MLIFIQMEEENNLDVRTNYVHISAQVSFDYKFIYYLYALYTLGDSIIAILYCIRKMGDADYFFLSQWRKRTIWNNYLPISAQVTSDYYSYFMDSIFQYTACVNPWCYCSVQPANKFTTTPVRK